MTVQLHSDIVPYTVANFITHSQNGDYDGVAFHRLIPEMMMQSGRPKGSDEASKNNIWDPIELAAGFYKAPPEEKTPGMSHKEEGMLSMASTGPTRGQIVITLGFCPSIDKEYTIFGNVVDGYQLL